jgi:hypothetical protein
VYQTRKSQPLAAQVRQQTTRTITPALLEQQALLEARAAAGLGGIQVALAREHPAAEALALLLLVVLVVAVREGRVVSPVLQMAVLAVMLQQMARVAVAVVAVNPEVLGRNLAHIHQLRETRVLGAWLSYIAQEHSVAEAQLQPIQVALGEQDGTVLAVVLAVVL